MLVVAACAAVLRLAQASAPTLHEYVPPDPADEAELGVASVAGVPGEPSEPRAQLETSSGTVTAPDVDRPIGSSTPRYGEKSAPRVTFAPDRDTRELGE